MAVPAKISSRYFSSESLALIDQIADRTLQWALRCDSIYLDGVLHIRKDLYNVDDVDDGVGLEKVANEIEKLLNYRLKVHRVIRSDISWLEVPKILKSKDDLRDPFITQYNLASLRIALDSITRHVGAVYSIQIAHEFLELRGADRDLGERFTHPAMQQINGVGVGVEERLGDVLFASEHDFWTVVELLYRIFMDALLDEKHLGTPIRLDDLWRVGSTNKGIGVLRNLRPEVRNTSQKIFPCIALGVVAQLNQGDRSRYCIGPCGFAFMQRVHKPLSDYIAGRMIPTLLDANRRLPTEECVYDAVETPQTGHLDTASMFPKVLDLGMPR